MRRRGGTGRSRGAIATVAVVGVLLGGCSDDPTGSAVTPSGSAATATATAEPTDDPTASSGEQGSPTAAGPTTADPSPARPAGAPTATRERAGGLTLPWSAAPHPSGGWLISLRDEARVIHLGEDDAVTPVNGTGEDGTVPGVVPNGEGGLLGLAVLQRDPQDGTGPWLYAYHTTRVDGAGQNAVVRMLLDAAANRLGAPEPVLSGIPAAGFHNGGRLAFGPDGMLYVTTGDAGETGRSQDPASLGGKILRLTPGGEVPPDNPFPGSPVWTLGHRNVQGVGWDASGRMFASEFGQNRLDELNLITPGANYGWPQVEGAGGVEGLTDPLVTWPTSDASPSGIAVTGDAVYLAALRGERLWRVPLGTGTGPDAVGPPEEYLSGDFGRLRDVVVTPQGELLVLTSNDDAEDVVVGVTLG